MFLVDTLPDYPGDCRIFRVKLRSAFKIHPAAGEWLLHGFVKCGIL